MKYLVSLIVPIFNSGNTLERTIDSLINQRLDICNYEIILVNDGSLDNSMNICEDYASRYSNIKIISQENQGVSIARNKGLEAAQGDYICFVDSDDTLAPGGLGYLFSHFDVKSYDLIRFWTKLVYGKEKKIENIEGEVLLEGNGFDWIEREGLEMFCYTFLYKKAFLVEKKLRFIPLTAGEDFLFASSALLMNPKILSTSCRIYNYIIRPNSLSTTRSTNHAIKCIESQIEANGILIKSINDVKLKEFDSLAYSKAKESLSSKMLYIFSRILSSDLPGKTINGYLKKCREQGILPVTSKADTFKLKFSYRIINILYYFPTLIIPSSYIYKHVFLPYFFPILDRNDRF